MLRKDLSVDINREDIFLRGVSLRKETDVHRNLFCVFFERILDMSKHFYYDSNFLHNF